MFLAGGIIYDNNQTMSYNKIFLEKLKDLGVDDKFLTINNKKKELNITLFEMKKSRHPLLLDFLKIQLTIFDSFIILLEQNKLPIDYVIESLSNIDLGINNQEFQAILIQALDEEHNDPKIALISVIKKIQKIYFDVL